MSNRRIESISRILIITIIGFTMACISNPSLAQLAHDPDINDDGVVDQLDVLAFNQCAQNQSIKLSASCLSSDLNGDGTLNNKDLIDVNSHFGKQFPTKAEAQALFPGTAVAVGNSPGRTVIADVNGDGLQDLISPDQANQKVTISLGARGNYFENPIVVPAPDPRVIAIGHIDRDDHVDMLVAQWDPGELRYFSGDGAGNFIDSGFVYSVMNNPRELILADINADSFPDAILSDSQLTVLLSNPLGGFFTPISIPVEGTLIDTEIADFNGDGKQDILAAYVKETHERVINVWQETESGAFTAGTPITIGSGYPNSSVDGVPVSIADIDGDNLVDLIHVESNFLFSDGPSGYVQILRNNGDGTFIPWGAINGLFYPGTLAVGRLNDDEHTDLIVHLRYEGLRVFHGDGFGGFTRAESFPIARGSFSRIIDMNGDSELDLVTTSDYSNSSTRIINVFHGSSRDALIGPSAVKIGGTSNLSSFSSVKFTDMNHDGAADLLAVECLFEFNQVGCGFEKRLTAASNEGTNQFQFKRALDFYLDPPVSWVTGSFNNDVYPDIAMSFSLLNSFSYFLGQDGITFSGLSFSYDEIPLGYSLLYSADMNADGTDEMIGTGPQLEELHIFTIDANNNYDLLENLQLDINVNSVVAADFDNDNFQDLALAADSSGQNIQLYRGNGTGKLTEYARIASNKSSLLSLAVADLNSDGNLDLVASGVGNNLSILLGQGDGLFFPPVSYAPEINSIGDVLQVKVSDINIDGIPDLAFYQSNYPSTVRIALGNGDGEFQPSIAVATGLSTAEFELADINGDSRLDIANSNISTYISIALQNTPENSVRNSVPSFSEIPDQIVSADGSSEIVNYVIEDDTTNPVALRVTAISTEPTLLIASKIELGGSGAERTIRVTPSAGMVGDVDVSLRVTDASGALGTQQFKVSVVDTTAPIISLNGLASQTFMIGDSYEEAGASATDNVDGDLTAHISIDSNGVNSSVAGTYTVTYSVSDAANNSAVQVRTLFVVAAPVTSPATNAGSSGAFGLPSLLLLGLLAHRRYQRSRQRMSPLIDF